MLFFIRTSVLCIATLILATIGITWGQSPSPIDNRPVAIREVETPAQSTEQERTELETDRDSFTPSVRTADPGRLITEAAYTFFNNSPHPNSHSYPELLLRYGLTDRVELRFGWNLERGTAADLLTGSSEAERESNLNLGTKLKLTEQNGWRPESALILAALVPTSGPETSTLFVGTYALGWEFRNRWKLDASMRYGMGVEEGDHFTEWAPSVVLKVPFGEKWSIHAEYFGIFTDQKDHDEVLHFFSPGVHYLVTPDFEIGTRVAWGLNDQTPRFLVNVGLGYRY